MKLLGMTLIPAFLLSVGTAITGSSPIQLAVAEPAGQSRPMSTAHEQLQVAVVCFYDSEITSGMNKICYYRCLQSLAAITLGFAEICPMSINE